MERATSLLTAALLASAGLASPGFSAETTPQPAATVDSLRAARDSLARGSSDSLARAPSHTPTIVPALAWTFGAGAPVFPQRARFKSELDLLASRDTLVIDQPWDGSQLGFSTALELSARWRFLRPTAGAEWSFWSSRSVFRNPRTEALVERTWRLDQLMGVAGVDALLPGRLLTIKGGHDPYFGLRFAYGVGRLEGLGRAWARGGGWMGRVGADVTSFGPIQVGGSMGWTSLDLRSDVPMSRVLYDGVGSDRVSWNGSGLWLQLVLRWDGSRRVESREAPRRDPRN